MFHVKTYINKLKMR